jgi:apolipoprotein N-acyltransferase
MFLIFLSAFLFYLSFPNYFCIYGFWPCIWFFAVPLLLALHEQPWHIRLGRGVLFGLCAYGLMARGVYAVSPAGFFIFVLALSVQSWMFACCFRSTGHVWGDIVFYPLLWSASEWARNILLGGFSFYISHAQAFCPLMLKLYAALGCLGMGFIIFLVNTLIYSGVVRPRHRFYYVLAAGIIFLSIPLAGFIKKDTDTSHAILVQVGVIQANISPWAKMDSDLFDRNAQIHLRLTQQSFAHANPDLVIWPETAFPDDLLTSAQWRPVIFEEAVNRKTDLLIGIAPIIDGKEYNSALLIGNRGQVKGLYHKQALVPFAENTPLIAWGIDWGRGYHFSAGDKFTVMTLSRKPVRFAVVICSESAHPSIVSKLHKAGAQFLVEISNDGWFTDAPSYMLHAQAAVMRAVEMRMWVIRAANTGFSFAVDPDGNIYQDGNIKLGHEGFGIFDIMVK